MKTRTIVAPIEDWQDDDSPVLLWTTFVRVVLGPVYEVGHN